MTFFPFFFSSFQYASARLTLIISWVTRCQTRRCSWDVGAFPAWIREGPAHYIVSGLTTLLCPSPVWGPTEWSPSSSAGNIAAAYGGSAASHWAAIAAGAGRYRTKKERWIREGQKIFFFWSPSSIFLLGALGSELCSRVARIKLLPSARTRWKANLLELHFWLLLPWSKSLVNRVINQGPKPTAIMRWSTEKKLQRKKPRQWRRHWFDFDSC